MTATKAKGPPPSPMARGTSASSGMAYSTAKGHFGGQLAALFIPGDGSTINPHLNGSEWPSVNAALHGDNGSTLKATTVLAMLNWLGVKPAYSRPRVSDDNAYAESLFRTAKSRSEFPARGFVGLETARDWAADFVHW